MEPPTDTDRQPWAFIVIREQKETMNELGSTLPYVARWSKTLRWLSVYVGISTKAISWCGYRVLGNRQRLRRQ